MNFFNCGLVSDLLLNLGLLIGESSKNVNKSIRFDPQNPDHQRELDVVKRLVEQCVVISQSHLVHLSSHIGAATHQLQNFINSLGVFSWSELNTLCRKLRDAVRIELHENVYYQYPKQKMHKLRSWKHDWRNSVEAFPNIKDDLLSALNCYGLEENTASVFHSMRVAEQGLRALAKERRIKLNRKRPVEWGNWGEIIKALDKEIDAIEAKRAGQAKDSALAFYSGARADLNGFKDEYRNVVMHVRKAFDEREALRALNYVNAFMERLSTKIDHKHHRIRWGLR